MTMETILRTSATLTAAATGVDFSGRWINQYGSVMDITVADKEISGTYRSAVSGVGSSVSGPLRGHLNGDLIAFTVNWPTAAITAWVGQLVIEGGADTVRTLWQMTTNIEEAQEPQGLWHSIFAGADRFTR